MISGVIRAATATILGVALWAGTQAEARTEPPAAEAFARIAAISSVSISPDGEHVAAIVSLDGEVARLSIWRADALSDAPVMVGTDRGAQILALRFISNERLLVTTQQLVEHDLAGNANRSFGYRTQLLDLEGRVVRTSLRYEGLSEAQQAFVGLGRLISSLPSDPDHILVASPLDGDVYRLNVMNGRASRIRRGSTRFSSGTADLNGEIRATTEFAFDGGAVYIGVWIAHPDTGEMEEHFRNYARDRKPVSIAAFTPDPNIILVETSRDRDHSAIYEYRLRERQFGDIAFAHPFFDASGVVVSTRADDFGEALGFRYIADRSRVYWIDPTLDAVEQQMRAALGVRTRELAWTDIASGETAVIETPENHDVAVIDWSDARDRIIVRVSGGARPPEYYVLADNRVRLLGRAYPELADAPLGPVSLVQYPARDGLPIPAFLTTPDPSVFGPGPWPAIVTPHGGPWARDDLDWDSSGWTQYFAARGYAVLQPQFRGSDGWGQRLWRAGDAQWGLAMQDDKDDGARWMIEQGIARPGEIAMHGYSYGGYAAMMAAVRSDGLYRCAAAGAGLSSIDMFKRATYDNRYLREFQHPTADGVDPLDHVGSVSIPVLLYTGDRDTNVRPAESRAFANALEGVGHSAELVILPDMEHSINTWTPANSAAILTTVDAFLTGACGLVPPDPQSGN